eukprot:comp9404_c0_seq1/m.4457 comp9404_c0_seq1/g.4457  ORF comp9404_c0_seq1/g.4457 comp9404_c0_seq1/m.4457 type:complete len:185 (-) comp9404_c0_seq1:494-1048(-)
MLPTLTGSVARTASGVRVAGSLFARWLATQVKGYDGLYLHKATDGKGDYVLSFQSDPNKAKGKAVIGWLLNGGSLKPSNFEENKEFRTLLNDTVAATFTQDDELAHQAIGHKEGWMHIQDYRNPAFQNRIPETEDIIGSVLVKDGELVPGTFQPMPVHRLLSMNGMFRLNTPLHEKLVAVVKNL